MTEGLWNGPEQKKNLERVTSKIGKKVMTFCVRIGEGNTFRVHQLHRWVGENVAPASADRILRNLRQKGHIDYHIVNRRLSLYRITNIGYLTENSNESDPDFSLHFDAGVPTG